MKYKRKSNGGQIRFIELPRLRNLILQNQETGSSKIKKLEGINNNIITNNINTNILVADATSTEKFITEQKTEHTIKNILTDELLLEKWGGELLEAFVNYRSEPNKKGKELRQLQKTWDLNSRLRRRKRNHDTNFGKNKILDYEDIPTFDVWIRKDDDQVKILKKRFRDKYGTEEMDDGRELRQRKYMETKNKRKQSPLYLKQS